MYSDSVLEELWRVKDENGAQYGWDIHRMAEALREAQKREGRRVVSFVQRNPLPVPEESDTVEM